MKLLCPRQATSPASLPGAAWVVASSYGGGLVSGDRLSLQVEVRPNACAVVTTQSSTKVFHADAAGTPATQTLDARVATGGLLLLTPEPIVWFADAVYEQRQRIDLDPGAGLVLLDWFTAGRVGSAVAGGVGERWAFRRYASRNRVIIDGTPRLHDALVLDGEAQPLGDPLTVGRFDVFATLVLAGEPVRDAADALLDTWSRAELDCDAAVQLGVGRGESPDAPAVFRLAGTSTQTVQRRLAELLDFLRPRLGRGLWDRKP